MTPDQIREALRKTETELIGLKKATRHKFGSPRAGNIPEAIAARLETLRGQCREYRLLLESNHADSGIETT